MKNSWILALAVLAWAPLAVAAPQEKFAVIVSRHGVRSPTWENARLNQYSAEPWPEWAVPPADLTPRGALLIKLMGGFYHEWFALHKFLTAPGCQDATRIYIWADTDQRTLETGRALGESLLPGCSIPMHSRPVDAADPLFAGAETPDPVLASKAIVARIPPDMVEQHRAAFDALQEILGKGPKKILEPPMKVSVNDSAQLTGPFNTASTLTENLLLEYANGFEGKQLGWGRLDEKNLFQVLELHTIYADLMRRTPYLARTRSGPMLRLILNSLKQAATGKAVPGAMGKPGDALLVLAGHDTNLSNLSGILNLSWSIPGYQADDTPPGGALVFSLWKEDNGSAFVRVEYVAQSMSQLHNATPLSMKTPPAVAEVTVPGCPAAACDLRTFQSVVERAISQP